MEVLDHKFKELAALRIFLKVLAWCVLGIAIVLSIFYTPTSMFLMVVYIMSVLIIFAILYALAMIVEMVGEADFKKKKETMKLSNKIQIGIFSILTLTAIFVGNSVCDQVTFNKNALRPWVNCKPIGDILIDEQAISFSYEMKNFGQIPALDLRSYSVLSLNVDTFPSSTIKAIMESDTNATTSSIFPSETGVANNSLKYGHLCSYSEMEQAFQRNEIFLHLYVSYSDISKRNLGHKLTTQLKYKGESEGEKKCIWVSISSSEEPIK